jgi:uncharacterized protein YbbC (DUF1343 family)
VFVFIIFTVNILFMMRFVFILLLFFTITLSSQVGIQNYYSIISGADQTELYLPLLKGKKVAIVTNASGIIKSSHLVDTLLKHKINIVKIFGPEHGFRGTADAGEKVKSGKDPITNISVISLYGAHKKPTKEDFKCVDVVVYDIQDVGVRFYTYISTMTYVMEACAENNKELIVLDRPNPNGFYIDGPVIIDKYKSFLGLHSVPIVYGMTCGEYAKMVNGEHWMKTKVICKLTVIPLKNYDRTKFVSGLPVKPSPNLPNDTAVLLYPSLGLFEGTIMSLGRGTDYPFQVIGNPHVLNEKFNFKPVSNSISKKPKYQDSICYGLDLRPVFDAELQKKSINVNWLQVMYNNTPNHKDLFFDRNFNYHSGNEQLKEQIVKSVSEKDIKDSWKPAIEDFKRIREKYLIYKDF